MLYITVPDMNDSMSQIVIDDTAYWIRFTYNETYDYWSFGIYDEDENPIIAMTRIVPNYPLLHWYRRSNLPDGIWGAITTQDKIGRQSFNTKDAEFVYIPNSEISEEGES